MRLELPLLLAVALLPSGLFGATTYYVSPRGNDAWSGTLPAPDAAGADGPFATVSRARDAIRKARNEGRKGSFTVRLRGGLYPLKETLTFGPEDSGTQENPVVYRAYNDEKPILSGARFLSGFEPATLNGIPCWRLRLPNTATARGFQQAYVRRRGTAYFERRYRPTRGMLVIAGLTYSPARKAAPHRAAQRDFRFFPGDVQDFHNLSDVEVVALHGWSASRLSIEHVDMQHHVVRFTSLPTFRIGHWYKGGRNPYYIDNIKEDFRRAGQWYLDRPEGMLYYAPMPGETPDNLQFAAPRLQTLVRVAGDPASGRTVDHLSFEGIAFLHAAWTLPKNGYDVSQGQPTLPAAVEITYARNCRILRCDFGNTGAYALSLGRGCHDNRVTGCFFHDLGGGGIKVGDPRMPRNAGEPVLPTGNTVENNVIAAGGRLHASANGIWAGIVKNTTIQHNEIFDFPYTGIAVGWSWGYSPTNCAGNLIAYNHIHHIMKLIEDGGAIYTLGQQPGTIIRGNVIHDCLMGPFAAAPGQIGIYLDEGSGPFLIEDNIVYDVQMGGFNLHYGRDNMVRNNIFAYIRQDPVNGGRKENHLSYTFERNIVYTTTDDMFGGRANPANCRTVFEKNLYWNPRRRNPLFGSRSFRAWQATGHDQGSLVADPRFVDPEHRDFRLRPTSPAFKLGIHALDPSRAGVEPAFRDVGSAEAWRNPPPVYAMKAPELPPPTAGFRLDFEDMPLGVTPHEFTRAGCIAGKGDFIVTDACAASGKRCLACYEKVPLRQPFYPYLIYGMGGLQLSRGKVTLAFAIRNHPENPDQVSMEFRDYATPGNAEFLNGPRLALDEHGNLTAAATPVGHVPNGRWARVSLSFSLDSQAPKTYTVVLTPQGGPPHTVTAAWPDQAFAKLTWFGIISNGKAPCGFYLDDMELTTSSAMAR